MSDSKYTPGPWEIFEGGNFVRVGAPGYVAWTEANSYPGGPLCVADVEYHATEDYSSDHAKAMANARLIAAAPELLEVARRVLAAIDPDGSGELCEASIELRHVIAKAEGAQ